MPSCSRILLCIERSRSLDEGMRSRAGQDIEGEVDRGIEAEDDEDDDEADEGTRPEAGAGTVSDADQVTGFQGLHLR